MQQQAMRCSIGLLCRDPASDKFPAHINSEAPLWRGLNVILRKPISGCNLEQNGMHHGARQATESAAQKAKPKLCSIGGRLHLPGNVELQLLYMMVRCCLDEYVLS